MAFLIVFYLVAITLWGLFTYALAQLLFERNRLAIPLAVTLWLFGLAFLFPIPIHGGFMLTGELWLEAIDEWQRERAYRAERERDEAFLLSLDNRFRGPLTTPPSSPPLQTWAQVPVSFGGIAYRHAATGLVFTEALLWQPNEPVDWEQGQSYCQRLAPIGSWALPTQTELYYFWLDGGHELSPWGNGSFVSILADETSRLRLTARHKGSGPEKLRCVARTGEPVTRTSINTTDWNRFQLDPERYR